MPVRIWKVKGNHCSLWQFHGSRGMTQKHWYSCDRIMKFPSCPTSSRVSVNLEKDKRCLCHLVCRFIFVVVCFASKIEKQDTKNEIQIRRKKEDEEKWSGWRRNSRDSRFIVSDLREGNEGIILLWMTSCFARNSKSDWHPYRLLVFLSLEKTLLCQR